MLLAGLAFTLPCPAEQQAHSAQAGNAQQPQEQEQNAKPAHDGNLTFAFQHPADSITSKKLSHSLQLTITSSKGFGWVEISREAKQAWPKQLLFELRYANAKPFTNLEMFSLQGDNWRMQGSLQDWQQQRPMPLRGAQLEPDLAKMRLQLKPLQDSILLLLDCSALANCSKLRLQWVDMLR